jgi:hypothetical protein
METAPPIFLRPRASLLPPRHAGRRPRRAAVGIHIRQSGTRRRRRCRRAAPAPSSEKRAPRRFFPAPRAATAGVFFQRVSSCFFIKHRTAQGLGSSLCIMLYMYDKYDFI